MGTVTPLDLPELRRSCAHCSLQALCLPGGIDGEELDHLDELVQRRRRLAQGARLFGIGERAKAVYVAREGALKSVLINENGDEQVLGFHLPGEFIGLDALGTGEHRCEAVALSPTSVCEVSWERLGEITATLPGMRTQLMRVVGRSFDRELDHKELLVRRQAGERIALFLTGLSARYSQIGHDGARIALPMSRHDIASHLGLALETVSRGFSRLEQDGLITVRGRELHLVDLPGLKRLSHGEVDASARQMVR